MKVWKYVLDSGLTVVSMPFGAKPIVVREQAGRLCLWAIVRDDESLRAEGVAEAALRTERRFLIAGTGHAVPNNATYIGSFFPQDALFAFHVFEV